MDFDYIHPRDQIVMIMERIYGYGMTTTSGGNLSILDDNGDLWITPSGIDKGSLQGRDIVLVKADGRIEGIHKPSVEYPFHLAIYKARPDVKAVLHAHPAALVSFSVAKRIPDTAIIPQARHVCGKIGYAAYAIPGSVELGERIAACFAEGFSEVMLENHGVVTAGPSLFEAFQRFETLDFCARISLKAALLGTIRPLTCRQFDLFAKKRNDLPEFTPSNHSSLECGVRKDVCQMLRRAYDHQLVTSTEGTVSVRIDKTSFVITPYAKDRKYLEEKDLVLVSDSKRENGKIPSRSVLMHQRLYERHPELGAIVIAHPPSVMAFAVTDAAFDTRTIPESYLVLRDIPKLPYGTQFMDVERLAATLSTDNPAVILENDCLIVGGENLLQAYDRLEVAEFTARALIAGKAIGEMVPISQDQINELKARFLHQQGGASPQSNQGVIS